MFVSPNNAIIAKNGLPRLGPRTESVLLRRTEYIFFSYLVAENARQLAFNVKKEILMNSTISYSSSDDNEKCNERR